MNGIAIRVGVVAVILIGGFVLRDRLTGSVEDLQVGDCFQATAAMTVAEIQHTPCNEGHTAEVFYVGDYPAGDNAAVPTDAQLETFVDTTCSSALLAYVGGMAAIEDPVFANLELNYFHPLAEGWSRGDREIICWIGSPDALTRSLRAAR